MEGVGVSNPVLRCLEGPKGSLQRLGGGSFLERDVPRNGTVEVISLATPTGEEEQVLRGETGAACVR